MFQSFVIKTSISIWHLLDLDLVDNVFHFPVQVNAVLPMPKRLNVQRAHLGIGLVLNFKPFCGHFSAFLGLFST